MTLFPLLPEMMAVAVCGRARGAPLDAIHAAPAEVDQVDPAGGRKEKPIPAGRRQARSPGPRGRAAQIPCGEDGPSLPGETRGTFGAARAGRMTSWCPAGSMNRPIDSGSISAVGFWKRAAEG
jgi:hypothetical protein